MYIVPTKLPYNSYSIILRPLSHRGYMYQLKICTEKKRRDVYDSVCKLHRFTPADICTKQIMKEGENEQKKEKEVRERRKVCV